MKSIAKHVFVFMCAIALLFCLTGNLLGAVANASTSIVSSRDDYLVYDTAIKNGVAPVQMTYYFGQLHYGYMTNYSTFTYITFDDLELPVITINESQVYSTGCSNAYFLSQDNKGDTVSYSSYMGNMKNLSKSGYDDSQVFYVTNAPKGTLDITNNANALIIYLDSEGNDVTNAVDKDDIVFEHYYNKNTDESHKLYVTNNSEYDMYITLECVLPTSSGDTVIYQYGENQLVSVAPFYYYYQLAYKNADVAAKWLSYFLYDNATAELTEDEIYQNLMSSSDKWHKADYYSSGTCTIAYQYGLGLTFSECMNRVDEITELENILSERNYAIEDNNTNIYQKNIYVLLQANSTKEVTVSKNQITLTSGVKYAWVLKIGSAVDKMGEHSRSGFTAISSSIGNDNTDNNVYDEDGNVIGSYDGNGNIIVDEEINSDYGNDTSPTINTESVTGFFNSLRTYFNMFYGLLPAPVMNVIIFGLSLIIAVGILKAVH